jgi:hypothetical protein
MNGVTLNFSGINNNKKGGWEFLRLRGGGGGGVRGRERERYF